MSVMADLWSPFHYFLWVARQPARESVSPAQSFHPVITSWKEPVESQRQPSRLCALLEGLELATQATRERGGGGTNDDRRRVGEGDEIQDERRNGLDRRRGAG